MTNQTRESYERSIIFCMILSERAVDAFISGGGDATWFASENCRIAAASMINHYAQGKTTCDVAMLATDTGLPSVWIEGVIDCHAIEAHIEHYTESLRGIVELDAINATMYGIMAKLRDAKPDDVDTIKSEIESSVHKLIMQRPDRSNDLTQIALEWIERMTNDDANALLDWPVAKITQEIGRIDRELIWLVAQPSCGKTAFCLQWLLSLDWQGHIGSMASLESPIESLVSRIIAQLAPMDTYPIRQRKATREQIERAKSAARAISDKMRIVDGSMTLDQLYAWGMAEVRRGSKLLIVDNTRHIRTPRLDNRVDQVAEISVRMKQLRDVTGVPVVICHHSNKDDDVSWSSDVRRDTDMLIFLRENDGRNTGVTNEGRFCIDFDVEKNREGRKDVLIGLEFIKHHQRFTEWA